MKISAKSKSSIYLVLKVDQIVVGLFGTGNLTIKRYKTMDDHYSDCDGLCYDCEEFTWCVFSPVNCENEFNILDLETNNIINN